MGMGGREARGIGARLVSTPQRVLALGKRGKGKGERWARELAELRSKLDFWEEFEFERVGLNLN